MRHTGRINYYRGVKHPIKGFAGFAPKAAI